MTNKIATFIRSRYFDVILFALIVGSTIWRYFAGGREDLDWVAAQSVWANVVAWFCFFKVLAIDRYLREKFPPRSAVDQKVLDNLRKRNG